MLENGKLQNPTRISFTFLYQKLTWVFLVDSWLYILFKMKRTERLGMECIIILEIFFESGDGSAWHYLNCISFIKCSFVGRFKNILVLNEIRVELFGIVNKWTSSSEFWSQSYILKYTIEFSVVPFFEDVYFQAVSVNYYIFYHLAFMAKFRVLGGF